MNASKMLWGQSSLPSPSGQEVIPYDDAGGQTFLLAQGK